MTLTREDAFKLAGYAYFRAAKAHEALHNLQQCPGTAGDHLDLLDFASKLRSAETKLRAYAENGDRGNDDIERIARYVRKHCGV